MSIKNDIQVFLREETKQMPQPFVYGIDVIAYKIILKINKAVIYAYNSKKQHVDIIIWDNAKMVALSSIRLSNISLSNINETAANLKEIIKSVDGYTQVDYLFLKAILTSKVLKDNKFAQSLAGQLISNKKLSPKQEACVIDMGTSRPCLMQSVIINDKDLMSRYCDDAAKTKSKKPAVQRTFNLKPDDGKNVTLIPTKDHIHYKYNFDNFNPVQSLVFPHIKKDINLIIGANTSAGKTICAELVMDHTLEKGDKIIYLSPLKSLTQEKFDDWSIRYENHMIEIMTGDYSISETKTKKLERANIICMTSEMLDSRTRNVHSEKNDWLSDVKLIIVDESHIIDSESRGHACEVGLMRFTKINKESRIIMLSATMPNVEEFGEWATNLNNKHTEIIFCNWRPVELKMNYVEYSNQGDYQTKRDAKITQACDIAISKPNEKFLIFVHDKATGRLVVSKLEDYGVDAVFHSADLSLNKRVEIESAFRKKKGGLRVLVSTSTLAWGVNLPARNVIIVGVHRGIQEVDELDLIQMIGRAGRYGIDTEGHVYCVLPQNTIDDWKNRFANPKPITSKLLQKEVIAFHIIGEININEINTVNDINLWYSRSLANIQKYDIDDDLIENVIQDLINMKMISIEGNEIKIKKLGRISAWMYFSPYDIYKWFTNFDKIFDNGDKLNESDLAWAVADIPLYWMSYIPKVLEEQHKEWKKYVAAKGYKTDDIGTISHVIAAYHLLKGTNPTIGLLKITKNLLKIDAQRITTALSMIDSMYATWGYDWNVFGARLTYGVPEEFADIIRIKGVGAKRAEKLYEMGFNSAEDIAFAELKDLTPHFTKKLALEIINNANKLIENE